MWLMFIHKRVKIPFCSSRKTDKHNQDTGRINKENAYPKEIDGVTEGDVF